MTKPNTTVKHTNRALGLYAINQLGSGTFNVYSILTNKNVDCFTNTNNTTREHARRIMKRYFKELEGTRNQP